MRAARAHAALNGRVQATEDDVLAVAPFVLPHRMKRMPFEEVGMSESVLEKAVEALREKVLEALSADNQSEDGGVEGAGDDAKKA